MNKVKIAILLSIALFASKNAFPMNWDFSDSNNQSKNQSLDERLYYAVVYQDSIKTFQLLKKGANPNYIDKFGNSLLYNAASIKDVEIVRLLLKYGADPNKANIKGETPLSMAISYGYSEIANVILEHIEKTKKQEKKNDGQNSQSSVINPFEEFDYVSGSNNLEQNQDSNMPELEDVTIEDMIDYEGINVSPSAPYYDGSSVNNGGNRNRPKRNNVYTVKNDDCIKKLGFNPFKYKLGGYQPQKEDKVSEIVKLIEDCCLVDDQLEGMGYKKDDIEKARTKIIRLQATLMSSYKRFNQQNQPKQQNQITQVPKLILRDAKRNAPKNYKPKIQVTQQQSSSIFENEPKEAIKKDKKRLRKEKRRPKPKKIYPLHNAVKCGEFDKVKSLIEKNGYKVDSYNDKFETPLVVAARHDQYEIVKYLIAKGANVNAMDDYADTTLHYAAQHGRLDIMQLLLQKSAKIDVEGYFGSPLHLASYKGKFQSVKFLVENGADITLKNEQFDDETSLHIAISQKHGNIAKYLIDKLAEKKLSLDETNLDDETPAIVAAKKGNDTLVYYLLEKGANLNKKDTFKKTALDYLEKKKHPSSPKASSDREEVKNKLFHDKK